MFSRAKTLNGCGTVMMIIMTMTITIMMIGSDGYGL